MLGSSLQSLVAKLLFQHPCIRSLSSESLKIADWLPERSGFDRRYRLWNFLSTALGEGLKSTSTNLPTSERATISMESLSTLLSTFRQRFFIASDNRFLPSAVRRPRLLLFAVGAEAAAFPFEVAAGEWVPSSVAIARLSRSLSLFNSATILSMSKIRSSGALLIC